MISVSRPSLGATSGGREGRAEADPRRDRIRLPVGPLLTPSSRGEGVTDPLAYIGNNHTNYDVFCLSTRLRPTLGAMLLEQDDVSVELSTPIDELNTRSLYLVFKQDGVPHSLEEVLYRRALEVTQSVLDTLPGYAELYRVDEPCPTGDDCPPSWWIRSVLPLAAKVVNSTYEPKRHGSSVLIRIPEFHYLYETLYDAASGPRDFLEVYHQERTKLLRELIRLYRMGAAVVTPELVERWDLLPLDDEIYYPGWPAESWCPDRAIFLHDLQEQRARDDVLWIRIPITADERDRHCITRELSSALPGSSVLFRRDAVEVSALDLTTAQIAQAAVDRGRTCSVGELELAHLPIPVDTVLLDLLAAGRSAVVYAFRHVSLEYVVSSEISSWDDGASDVESEAADLVPTTGKSRAMQTESQPVVLTWVTRPQVYSREITSILEILSRAEAQVRKVPIDSSLVRYNAYAVLTDPQQRELDELIDQINHRALTLYGRGDARNADVLQRLTNVVAFIVQRTLQIEVRIDAIPYEDGYELRAWGPDGVLFVTESVNQILKQKIRLDDLWTLELISPEPEGLVWYAIGQSASPSPSIEIVDYDGLALLRMSRESTIVDYLQELRETVRGLARSHRSLHIVNGSPTDIALLCEIARAFAQGMTAKVVSPRGRTYWVVRSELPEAWFYRARDRIVDGYLPTLSLDVRERVDIQDETTGRVRARLQARVYHAYAHLCATHPYLLPYLEGAVVLPDLSVVLPLSSQRELVVFAEHFDRLREESNRYTVLEYLNTNVAHVMRSIVQEATPGAVALPFLIDGRSVLVVDQPVPEPVLDSPRSHNVPVLSITQILAPRAQRPVVEMDDSALLVENYVSTPSARPGEQIHEEYALYLLTPTNMHQLVATTDPEEVEQVRRSWMAGELFNDWGRAMWIREQKLSAVPHRTARTRPRERRSSDVSTRVSNDAPPGEIVEA